MLAQFTKNLLVRYLYKEVSLAEKHQIEEELTSNYELRELLNELLEAKNEMPKVKFHPKTSTIENILKYGQSHTDLEPTI